MLRFTGGHASLDEEYDLKTSWENHPTWRTAKPTKSSGGKQVIDRIPEVFSELYPSPIKI